MSFEVIMLIIFWITIITLAILECKVRNKEIKEEN